MMIVLMTTACKNRPPEYTCLGDYTPYNRYPEKLTGKVKEMNETSYWAIPQGDSFKKGNRITVRDRDTLRWTNDFNAFFDEGGNLKSCALLDEKDQTISIWELSVKDKSRTVAKNITNDTIRNWRELNFDENGNLTGISQFKAGTDTLLSRCSVKTSMKRDTVEFWWYNDKNAPVSKHIFIYNGAGDFFRTEAYDRDGVRRASVEAKYNSEDKVSELIFYDRSDKIIADNYFTYEYDKKGNWTKAIVKGKNGTVIIEERKYTYYE